MYFSKSALEEKRAELMNSMSTSDHNACRPLPDRATQSTEFGPDNYDPRPAIDPMLTTHRVTYSDRLKVFIGPHERLLSFLRPLRRLDGRQRYSVNLTRLPAPMRANEITTAISTAPGANFVQCIGSADALAIEFRQAIDGVSQQFIVGLPGSRVGVPNVFIPHADRDLRVYPDEVFTADQAADLVTTYFHTGDLPHGLRLRASAE